MMLALFGQHAGELHDTYAVRAQGYLFKQSLTIIAAGIDVILDWGFWTGESRRFARSFYEGRGIPCEFHCIHIREENWRMRLEKRNAAVLNGQADLIWWTQTWPPNLPCALKCRAGMKSTFG